MYYNAETDEWPFTEADVRKHFEDAGIAVGWSSPFTPIAPFIAPVRVEPPTFDGATHKRVEVAPLLVDNEWLQRWAVVALTAEEIAQRAAEQAAAEQAERDAARITVSRTQGLVFIWRTLRVTEADVEAMIAGIEDEGAKYEAGLYFRAATWDSDNPHVLMFGAGIGLDTPAKLEDAFRAAKAL